MKSEHGQALLYLADLQQQRGRVSDAEATLNRLLEMPEIDDKVLSELAGAFERVGRQDKAIEVTEIIRARREVVAEDVEMRLAWLYSEVGDEEKALQQWLDLWRKTTSIPRRRYVEDRLMTVASRLGTLADIAIELEEKLADGNADDREAGLLVRIYSRVNDSVAATEILEEYMTQTGRNEIERLQEKGRIYQICNDYWNYEKVIERLIDVDPEGKTEYLRQLALSMLERGKAQQARAVLLTLRDADDGKDSIGGEFEAGVLSLVGMRSEAADAYRRGIATYPDRIESYLLLANLMKEMGQIDRAVGMFQCLAENADRDDLFTIAIDGLLNMQANAKVMQWARRITLQRLAGREDKNYLYQLLADLSSEVNDRAGQIRAMENSLAVSGTRRLSVLRECMDLSSRIRGGVFYSTSSRGPTNAGNKPFFAFGRRLIGLGELMPPQVFLDLGQAFLADGDVASAERTFAMARNLADERSYRREVASIFEKAGKREEALQRYDRLLRTSPSDVAMMARVAKLNEQLGRDQAAYRFYTRGLNLLLAQTPLTTREENAGSGSAWSWGGNRDAYQTYSDRLLRGLLVTVPEEAVDSLLQEHRQAVQASLAELQKQDQAGEGTGQLSDAPRLDKQLSALTRMYFATDRVAELESLENALLDHFQADENLLTRFANQRIQWGRYDSARKLLNREGLTDAQRPSLAALLGETNDEANSTSLLAPREMWRCFLPLWISGNLEEAKRVLRRVDQSQGRSQATGVSYVIINGMAVPQQVGGGAYVSSWMRLALRLGDEGLALQFARSRLQQKGYLGTVVLQRLFDGYRDILPAESFEALARYAANLYQDDPKRVAEYMWVISQLRDQLGDNLPSDEKLLEMVEDSNLQIGYRFPFATAYEAFPESIRSEAIAHAIDSIDKKMRPRELVAIPFEYDKPIDPQTAEVILDAIESGIQPALQDDYLRYVSYRFPRRGKALPCAENFDLAVGALDLLASEQVRKRQDQISGMATCVKAVLLHQAGRTEEALEIVLPGYDSETRPSDYYHRNAQDWARRELIQAAPRRFLETLDAQVTNDKPSVSQTNKRLSLVKQTQDDSLIRETYLQAIKDHPEQTNYAQQYEQWEQRAGRVIRAINLVQQQLDALSDSESDLAKAKPLRSRLAKLWFSVNHRVKGMPLWIPADDKDLASFETQRQAREKKQQLQGEKKSEPDSKATASNTPAKVAAPKPSKSNPQKKDYPTTIAGVKSALDDENPAAVKKTLRQVWRAFPAVVESPYGYRTSRQRISGLSWPKDSSQAKAKQPAKQDPTEEELREARRKSRQRQRGGLATFQPPTPRQPAAKPDSAWKVLAAEPVGVGEMRRILRSRTSTELNNATEVILGLLQADRQQRGDQVVLDDLIQKISQGRLGTLELTQFFALVEEDHHRLDGQRLFVVDTLMEQLDLTQPKLANRMAKLCGQLGQLERAASLYTQCTLLGSSNNPSFAGLIKDARESFEGDALMDLAEQMFAVASRNESTINQMLDLRMELLSPGEAARRSADLFSKLDQDAQAYSVSQALRGSRLFAQAGELELAQRCLSCALLQLGRPRQAPSPVVRYSYSSARTVTTAS
ncbi:MAG: hypothetical protein MI861_28995, partial [Pirellulales bacterium]|nr:hypothetical protein [Pirellulales bacterium]